MKIKTTQLRCSACGHKSQHVQRNYYGAMKLIKAGWGSCGDAVYCPQCSKTWSKRNSRKMNSELGNLGTMMDRFLADYSLEADSLEDEVQELRTIAIKNGYQTSTL